MVTPVTAAEIAPVRKLGWDIRSDGFSCCRLALLAIANPFLKIMIALEIPPVRQLDWDIRPDGFSDSRLAQLARAECGMNIPLQSTPNRHLLDDLFYKIQDVIAPEIPPVRKLDWDICPHGIWNYIKTFHYDRCLDKSLLITQFHHQHDRTGDSSGATVGLGHSSPWYLEYNKNIPPR